MATFATGRSAAASGTMRPSATDTRTRRTASGSAPSASASASTRLRPSLSSSAVSAAAARSTAQSTQQQRKADPASARLKSAGLVAPSPSPPRKVRNPLAPVPALPALPPVRSPLSTAPATASSKAAAAASSSPSAPTPPAVPASSSGTALSGTETDDELAKTMRATKKRAAPDSFDVRAGGSAALAAAAAAAAAGIARALETAPPSASGTDGTHAAKAEPGSGSAETAARLSAFHVGSSGAPASASSAAARTRSSRGLVAAASPSDESAPMDADELALGAGPLPTTSSAAASAARVPEGGAAAVLERIASRRSAAAAELREREQMRSPLAVDSDTDSAHGAALAPTCPKPLRSALKRADSGTSNASSSSSTAAAPTGLVGASRRDSIARAESPRVRTPLEPIPELAGEPRRRRRADDDDDDDQGAGAARRGSGNGNGYPPSLEREPRGDGRRPTSTSPTFSRPSPTRTTRFAPLPPSHSGEQLRRERASSDADRFGSGGGGGSGNGSGSGRAPLPLTRSLASFEDFRASVPLPSHASSTFAPHAATGLPLHSTPAPPSRQNGGHAHAHAHAHTPLASAAAYCTRCGLPSPASSEDNRKPSRRSSSSPPPASAALTQSDLDEAIARVTDVLEARLADVQLDILRSARQSRNAILDEVRALQSAGLGAAYQDEEGQQGELERLREENRRLRALLEQRA